MTKPVALAVSALFWVAAVVAAYVGREAIAAAFFQADDAPGVVYAVFTLVVISTLAFNALIIRRLFPAPAAPSAPPAPAPLAEPKVVYSPPPVAPVVEEVAAPEEVEEAEPAAAEEEAWELFREVEEPQPPAAPAPVTKAPPPAPQAAPPANEDRIAPADPRTLPPPPPWVPLAEVGGAVAVPHHYLDMAHTRSAPTDAKGWRHLADQLALDGNLRQAADVHLQRGALPEAIDCLADAGDRPAAALLAIGAGNYGRAVELMVDAVDAGVAGDSAELLVQLLINLGEYDLADQLIHRRLIPEITEESAPAAFHCARLFDEAGALVQAKRLYEELIPVGNNAGEMKVYLRSVRRRLNAEAEGASNGNGGATGDVLTSQLRRKLGARDFLQLAIDEPDDTPGKRTARRKISTFAFSPPSAEFNPVDLATPRPTTPRHQMSLLGSTSPAGTLQTTPRYRYEREIRRGRIGSVFAAHDLLLDQPVVIKQLRSFGNEAARLRQLIIEGRAMAQWEHPHVVRVYDLGVIDLDHYIAMEHLAGGDLATLIEKAESLESRDAMRIFVEVAEGLACAHGAGVLHRGINPTVVLFSGTGEVRLMDFGVAQLAPTPPRGSVSPPKPAPTLGYVAPEVLAGEQPTPAADIYALGIMLFTMLVGAPPHRVTRLEGEQAIAQAAQEGRLPSLHEHATGIPAEIEHLYRHCTAADPARRYRRVEDFLPTARRLLATLEPAS